jgi:hypothetical protein
VRVQILFTTKQKTLAAFLEKELSNITRLHSTQLIGATSFPPPHLLARS